MVLAATQEIEVHADDTVAGWRPHAGAQTEALSRTEFEVLYGGARGGGKTDAGQAWLVTPNYINHERYRALVIRRNAKDLTDWIARARLFYRPLQAVFAGNPPEIRFPSGATFVTGHLKDSNAYENYQGHEYQKILIEEATQIPYETDYEKLISSCRSTADGLRPQVFLTANPGGPGHVWVKARFVDVARLKTYFDELGLSRIFIPSTVDDNPTLMKKDPMYVKRIEAIKDEKLRKAWRYGDWSTFSGQFFDNWSDSIHICKPFQIPDHWLLYSGLDWGYTAPAPYGWMAIDHTGCHYLYRELYESGNAPTRYAEKVLGREKPDETRRMIRRLADPAVRAKDQYATGNQSDKQTRVSIEDMLAAAGLHVHLANNDRINGWQRLKDLMYWDANTAPKFKIFDNCKETIRTIPGLVHDDHNVEDVDTDGEDHLADMIRYIVMHTTEPGQAARAKSETERLIDEITFDNEHGEQATAWDEEL